MQPGNRETHRFPRSLSTLWRALLAAALTLLSATPAFAASRAQAELPCAEVVWSAITQTPVTLRGCEPPRGVPADAAAAARSFLDEHSDVLRLSPALDNLSLVSQRRGLAGSHVTFQQTAAGRPVLGSYITLHLDDDNGVAVLHNGYLPQLAVAPDAAAVSAVRAVQTARQAIGFTAPRGDSPAPQLAVLPLSPNDGRLVWQVIIVAANPAGDWEVLVDAETGEVIKRANRLVFDRGQVFQPATPSWLAAAQEPLELAAVTLQGLDGSGWLRGEYVDLTALDGVLPARALSPAGEFVFDPDDSRFEEVMVYHYVDATQRYLQSLGYSDDNAPANGIRQRVTPASAHWFAQDQSFFSASDDALHFGDGGVNDAEDPDIIVHEYAHALQHDQLPYWGSGDMDAIGEGFADYLAASRFADQSVDPACFAERDSRGYLTEPPFCLRRVDRSRQYPVDLSGDPHQDGEIWSRVLWDLRGALGAPTADRLALESNFYLPPAASLIDAGQALLDADTVLNGGAHSKAIRQALVQRGLLPLAAPGQPVVAGSPSITPASAAAISWRPGTDLPVAYEAQVSLDSTLAGTLEHEFTRRNLPAGFTSYGALPWRVENGALRAGSVSHRQTSAVELIVELAAAGQLSFDWGVESEAGGDLFTFSVDGESLVERSGDSGASTLTLPLPAGQHRLVWRYRKDSTLSQGADTAWIDNLRITNASLANWRPAEVTLEGHGGSWQAPDAGSRAARLRVRARLGDVVSPWSVGQQVLVIEEPTAVGLAGFQAGPGGTRLPWLWLGIAALAVAALATLGTRLGRRLA